MQPRLRCLRETAALINLKSRPHPPLVLLSKTSAKRFAQVQFRELGRPPVCYWQWILLHCIIPAWSGLFIAGVPPMVTSWLSKGIFKV